MAKKVTIQDLADRLNLSTATVSRALRDHPSINEGHTAARPTRWRPRWATPPTSPRAR